MMKLLLAVIATCALVVSPTCIKIKHQLRSNAPTIHVLISNGNTQMTSQVSRNGSHRFITDNLSSMTLAPAGSQTIQLSYDEIFPITDAAVCTEVHPVSAGGCADGVCCKFSISMYTITDAIIMTARVNNRKADGNPEFWKCEQEIQVPGVTNTELSPEELVTDILHSENIGDYCSTNAHCSQDHTCTTVNNVQVCVVPCGNAYCDANAECGNKGCECKEPYVGDGYTCSVRCDTSTICQCGWVFGSQEPHCICSDRLDFSNDGGATCLGCTIPCQGDQYCAAGVCRNKVGYGGMCIFKNQAKECISNLICQEAGSVYRCL